MNTVAGRVGAGHSHAYVGRREQRNASRSRSSNRLTRFAELRQRRRRGALWFVLAAVAVFGAWDIAGRLDEVVYNGVFSSGALEARHEAMR